MKHINITNKKAIQAIISVLLMSLPTNLFANPSYEETYKFLREKLNTKSSDGATTNFSEISPCSFKLHTTSSESSSSTEFNARDIDPTMIVISNRGGAVIAESIRREKTIKQNEVIIRSGVSRGLYEALRSDNNYRCDNNSCKRIFKGTSVVFNRIISPKSSNSSKVAKALRHIVKLCGGKGELF